MTGQGDASVAQTFHETFNGSYTEFLDTLFEEMLSNRKDWEEFYGYIRDSAEYDCGFAEISF